MPRDLALQWLGKAAEDQTVVDKLLGDTDVSDIDEAGLRAFTPYAVDYRYPVPGPPTPIDRASAFGLVRQLRAWVEAEIERLAPPSPSP